MNKSKSLFICAVLSLFTNLASADIGGFLKDLKSAADTIQKNAPSSNTKSAGNTATSNYCSRLTASPTANKLAELIQKGTRDDDLFISAPTLDNANKDLHKWVEDNFKSKLNIQLGAAYSDNRINDIEKSINDCFKKNFDNPIYAYSQILPNKRDRNSDVLTIAGSNYKSLPRQLSPTQLALFTFLFDGADEFILKSNPNVINDFQNKVQARIDEQDRKQKVSDANEASYKKAQKENEDSLKLEKEKQLKEQQFIETNDGKLVWAYQQFQAVQTCYDIRKDMLVQLVTSSEYESARKKIKAIETKQKLVLQEKDIDKLWSLAIKRNAENYSSGLVLGLIEAIKASSKTNFTAAKSDCTSTLNTLNSLSDEIVGKEIMKKNF